MKAVVYKGPRKMTVEEVEDPEITAPTDIIVRVTSAAICGSDLHIYEGRANVEPGTVVGHEIMGVVETVGDAVQQLKVGDRVVLPFNIACGECFNCVRGWTNACLFLNPNATGAAFGSSGMGPYRGGQAQKVLVPYGDFNALKLPGTPGDSHEDDFLMLADIFPSALHACELAKVNTGYSVAIFGAGPVGLLSVMSARLIGAAHVYVIDCHEDRLQKAKELGAIPINFTQNNPAKFIANFAKQYRSQAIYPGEDRMLGVLSGIDAVGCQALDFADPTHEDHEKVIEALAEVVEPTGAVGLIGVYSPEDPGGNNALAKKGTYPIPLGMIWNKSITIGMGQCPVKKYNAFLRETIIAEQTNPGTIVSHHIGIDEAPEYYERCDKREHGVTKVVIRPND